jgi:hypothetical protein
MKQREEIEWTPVSDGWPPIVGRVLTQWKNGRITIECPGPGFWSFARTQGIVAWAKLPRGYRPEEGV